MPEDIEYDESLNRPVESLDKFLGRHFEGVIIDEAGNLPPPMPELDDALERCFEAVTRGFVAVYDPTLRARAGEVTVMQDTRSYDVVTSYSSVPITNRPLGLIGALDGVVMKVTEVELDKTMQLPPIDTKPYMGPARNRKEKRAERARAKRGR
jgi:hypothetical protein